MQITTTREFRKHNVLGDIYAVEFIHEDGARVPVAALRCTRPEELTRGALPVLTLANGDDRQFVLNNADEFGLWEPPMVDEEKLASIYAAETYCQDTEAEFERCHKAAAAAKKLHEKACDDLRRIVREANRSEPPAPLLALAEMPPPATDFDADMERFDDDRDDGTAH